MKRKVTEAGEPIRWIGFAGRLPCLLALVWLAGCSGRVNGDGGEDDPEAPTGGDGTPGGGGSAGGGRGGGAGMTIPSASTTSFSCGKTVDSAVAPLRRLSRLEYGNTIADLTAVFPDAQAVQAALRPRLAEIPEDSSHPSLTQTLAGVPTRKLDTSMTDAHVETFYRTARAFADQAVATPERTKALLGDCAVDASVDNDAACLDGFLRTFGRRVMRRPLREAEAMLLRDSLKAGGGRLDANGIRAVVTVLLSMPGFLYHLEDGGKEVGPGIAQLSRYELASRLSFLLWQRAPDDALLAAAEAGELDDDARLEQRVAAMFDDPRTDGTLDEFFAGWLENEHLGKPWELVGNAQYDAFRGALKPSAQLQDDMRRDVTELAKHAVRTGKFQDLFASRASFARTPELASIYGVAPTSGKDPVMLPDGGRAGVLTRAGLVASDIAMTRPILKGIFVMKRVLCVEVPSPPPNVPTKVEIPPPYTRRAGTESLTQKSGSSCASCHNLINPFGFATEGYDALGRRRGEERYIDESGKVVASLPIDERVKVQVDGKTHEVADGIALSDVIAGSGDAQACFARHWARFALGRPEDEQRDGCVLEAVRKRIASGGRLRDALVAVAREPGFRTRRFQAP